MKGRILVVDDEKNLLMVIQAQLERAGYEVVPSSDSKQGLEFALSEDFDAVLTDLYMPELNGFELIEKLKSEKPSLPIVMMTAFGTVESAVQALKKGAFDFITKPFDQAELLKIVDKASQTSRKTSDDALRVSSMIGASGEMQDVLKIISKIAATPSTVLIHGESGTGKELVAFEIHKNSTRNLKPFIKINCAAIPATLIESEFFGYEKGAFTGANASKPGRFELAHEGTLFLDEVAEMPLEMQVKLLRALQEQEFERVGGVQTIRVDVRIVAATNRDLDEEVKTGRFREDLFYRLNVVPIVLPPLRNRKDDIELLTKHFIAQFNPRLSKAIGGVNPKVMAALRAYSWPGNIRQLENIIERMMLMTESKDLQPEDLPEEIRSKLPDLIPSVDAGGEESHTFKDIVRRERQNLERNLIERALQDCNGNITHAADKLKLSRKGLQLKMKELGFKRYGD